MTNSAMTFIPATLRSLFVLAFATIAISARAEEPGYAILPSDIGLEGRDSQQPVALFASRNGQTGPMVASWNVEWSSSNAEVATVIEGVVRPVGDGTAKLAAVVDGQPVAEVAVTVSGCGEPTPWSFRHDVQSVLARAGCNMGACHGALAGKGGFRLSLRGYDSPFDFASITRQARGRRINLDDPGRSLLLAKPTGALPHKGGLRLDVDSEDYRVLAEWIAQGAAAPESDDPRLESIEVFPKQSQLQTGDRSRILVHAHYSDGTERDVTRWAKFTATDAAILSVDEAGFVDVRGPGEGAVSVWFGSQISLARFTVPFDYDVPDNAYTTAPRRNFIDDLVLDQLRQLRLRPAERCSDSAFLRRTTLDCIGRLPTAAETVAFLESESPSKRDEWIEQLLARDEFVDYWAYKWSDVLLVNGNRLRPAAVKAYYQWIREAVQENRPWDQIVKQVLTARGSSVDNGATNFYALHQTPEEMTENACQAFMGLSIGCAKCHNHPLEKWTNDQYYSMANLFARVRAKGWGGDTRNGDGIRTLYVAKSGDLIQPSTGKPQPPAPLDAEPLPIDAPEDRRVALADWMTSPENPYFARAITNRVWKNFFGVGLIEEVDDLRLSNPASNEPLLQAASDHLVDADFDLKQLMRAILQSETYQRASLPTPQNEADRKYYSRYFPRRLMAEVLLDAIDQVLATSSSFTRIAFSGADSQKTDFYPEGTRALQLYDSAVESYFLKAFGRNSREITCECQRSAEPSMVQVLHLSNGTTLNPKLAAEGNRIDRQLEAGLQVREIVESLFLTALARRPTEDEAQRLLNVIGEYDDADRRRAIEDAYWSVLTSSEFLFNH